MSVFLIFHVYPLIKNVFNKVNGRLVSKGVVMAFFPYHTDILPISIYIFFIV